MIDINVRKAAFLMLVVVGALSGCASTGGGPGARERTAPKSWWYASFKIDMPENAEPAWEMDALIAHLIVSPVIKAYGDELGPWRFHRRAAPDEAGHRFSFVFYATQANARKIYKSIQSNPLLNQLMAEGVILQFHTDDTDKLPKPNIEDTSDPHWSAPLGKAWPYFIHGVSRTWLDLIDRYAEDGRKKPSTLSETRAFYRQINSEVEKTWEKEGGHAFLHHLNAVFGYGPVNLRGKMEMSF